MRPFHVKRKKYVQRLLTSRTSHLLVFLQLYLCLSVSFVSSFSYPLHRRVGVAQGSVLVSLYMYIFTSQMCSLNTIYKIMTPNLRTIAQTSLLIPRLYIITIWVLKSLSRVTCPQLCASDLHPQVQTNFKPAPLTVFLSQLMVTQFYLFRLKSLMSSLVARSPFFPLSLSPSLSLSSSPSLPFPLYLTHTTYLFFQNFCQL